MADKAPYKLAIKMSSARPEAIGDALKRLREIASDYDQTGEATATLTFGAYKEAPLREIRESFEVRLYHYQIGVECEVTQKAPGLRGETVTALRANRTTPMDQRGWEEEEEEETEEAIITPPPVEPLALPAAGETLEIDDVAYVVEDE